MICITPLRTFLLFLDPYLHFFYFRVCTTLGSAPRQPLCAILRGRCLFKQFHGSPTTLRTLIRNATRFVSLWGVLCKAFICVVTCLYSNFKSNNFYSRYFILIDLSRHLFFHIMIPSLYNCPVPALTILLTVNFLQLFCIIKYNPFVLYENLIKR